MSYGKTNTIKFLKKKKEKNHVICRNSFTSSFSILMLSVACLVWGFPVPCWMEVVRVGKRGSSLTLEKKFSTLTPCKLIWDEEIGWKWSKGTNAELWGEWVLRLGRSTRAVATTAAWCVKVAKRVNPKSSHHKKKIYTIDLNNYGQTIIFSPFRQQITSEFIFHAYYSKC